MGVEIGQTVSHYKILRKLGHGGMGDVYLAENTRLGLKVALKFLAPELTRDPNAIKRLEHEARAVAELTHPNISRINDIEEADGHRFLVLEYLEGETLSDRIQRGPLPIEETIRIGKALAEGLAHAHSHGIIHRDIKAPNVMMTSDGGVKIMDFGLARMADATRLTEAGTTLGTVSHMSPEQASGKEADERSDLWSLGVVLYQCLTGRLPFEGETASIVLNRIGTAHPAPPTSLRTGVPMDLDRTILRCLEKDPGLRYQHADDLLAELRRLEGSASASTYEASTVVIPSQSQKPGTGRRRAVVIVVVAAIAVAVAAIWRPWENNGPADPYDKASNSTVPERPNWILLADFEGPPEEAEIAVAARELVFASLVQSRIVTPLSRTSLTRGLKLAMKPDSIRIVGEVAQQLAYRAGAGVYVEGRVDRVMTGYSIVFNVMNAESGDVLSSVNGVADNQDVFFSTLNRLAKELRKGIASQLGIAPGTGEVFTAITPSFPAYQKWVQAGQLYGLGDYPGAIALCRQALDLDAEFAGAWSRLGTIYASLGYRDSSQVARSEALARPNRLTEEYRIRLEAAAANSISERIRIYKSGLRRYPFSVVFHNNIGWHYQNLGRYEDASRHYAEASRWSPFGPSTAVLWNQFATLIQLGRYEEAREFPGEMSGWFRSAAELTLPAYSGEFARAESLATTVWTDPGTDPLARFSAALVRASAAAVKGEVRTAERRLFDAEETAPSLNLKAIASFGRTHISIVCRTAPPIYGEFACEIEGTAAAILEGIAAALSDDIATAKNALAAAKARPAHERELYPTDTKFLEALIALRVGAPEHSIRQLEPFTRGAEQPDMVGILPFRWTLGEAFSDRGDEESAALWLEQVLSPAGLSNYRTDVLEVLLRGIPYSFAHHRLVLLYSRMGRVEDARRHWEIFEKTFTNPDPELVPMIEEARKAIEEAEGKAAL